jgi:uncharacterized caspase-like protein
MPIRAMTLSEVAVELGIPPRRFHRTWPTLVAQKGLPRPVLDGETPKWSAAQFYTWQDRRLGKEQRAAAAAYRAAYEAASAPGASLFDTTAADQQMALEARYVRG